LDRWAAVDSELFAEVAKHYRPFAVTAVPVAPGSSQQALAGRLPFVAAMQGRPSGAAAHLPELHLPGAGDDADALAAGL
jgi:hypothetical protein